MFDGLPTRIKNLSQSYQNFYTPSSKSTVKGSWSLLFKRCRGVLNNLYKDVKNLGGGKMFRDDQDQPGPKKINAGSPVEF